MGRPRLIILVRHAQSEGNKNRDIHQTVPDHRVQLTPDGWKQAEEAGKKLRSLLRPSDTLHFFTSPYRRTRETTEGILNALTTDCPEPSPFPRHTITVYEEPRLREQDFGNFQPDSAEMSRMWQERADYGHFFYRIPNGESAADAYDRVSGFHDSLWRNFGEENFASVCVLVTHGLMTRVFLMKWYHFSVEYFEDLRNMEHCEFVVMKLNDNGKYELQNNLRTWSELQRQRGSNDSEAASGSPVPVRTPWDRWGGHQKGDSGDDFVSRQEMRRKDTADLFDDDTSRADIVGELTNFERQHPKNGVRAEDHRSRKPNELPKSDKQIHSNGVQAKYSNNVGLAFPNMMSPRHRDLMQSGRDGGGSRSGIITPDRSDSEGSDTGSLDYIRSSSNGGSLAMALNGKLQMSRKVKDRIRADALGDQSDPEDDENHAEDLKRRGRAPTSSSVGL